MGLAGCATWSDALSWREPGTPDGAERFRAVARRWTRHATAIRRFVSVIDAQVLWKSWPVREAWVEEQVRERKLGATEAQQLMAREQAAFEEGYEFLVAVYCSEEDWNDLDDPDSVWTIELSNREADSVRPERIELVELPPAERWRYFPEIRRWSRTYSIRFPRWTREGRPLIPPGGTTVTLCFRSVLAQACVSWEIEV
jgi:hypothetical protein